MMEQHNTGTSTCSNERHEHFRTISSPFEWSSGLYNNLEGSMTNQHFHSSADENEPLPLQKMEVDLGRDDSLHFASLEKPTTMDVQCNGKDDGQGSITLATSRTSYLSQPSNWDGSWSSFDDSEAVGRLESIELNSNPVNTTHTATTQEAMMFWHRSSDFPNGRVVQNTTTLPQMQVQVLDNDLLDTPQPQRHHPTNGYYGYQPQYDCPSANSYQGHFNVAWTRNTTRAFDDSYTIKGQPIGEGGFGVVYSCVSKQERRQKAVKIIAAEDYDRNEIEILQLLSDAPYIVTLQDIFFGFDRVYLVMEEMKGDLLTRLNKKVFYPEAEARTVIHTLLEAVQFLHQRGVAHRDIKPENILVDGDDTRVKLADFGLAQRFRDAHGNRLDPNMFTMCGSVWYAAPEVFGRPSACSMPYDERCDIWSIGILTYLLLAGYMPFLTEASGGGDSDSSSCSDYEVVQEVTRGKYQFHEAYWGNISLAAKQLISSLLKVHPVQRCTIQEALDCPWIVLPITSHFLEHNNAPLVHKNDHVMLL